MEKAELLGLTMAEVAAVQEIKVDDLVLADSEIVTVDAYQTAEPCRYRDEKNQCEYAAFYTNEPLAERVCVSYSTTVGQLFETDGEGLIGELEAIFQRMR